MKDTPAPCDATQTTQLLRESCPALDPQSLALLAPALADGRAVEIAVRLRLPSRLAAALWHGDGSLRAFFAEAVECSIVGDFEDPDAGEWVQAVRRLFGCVKADAVLVECPGVSVVG